MEEEGVPMALLAIDAAAIVSETDAAHSHSSGDEDEGWLSSRHHRARRCVVTAESTIHEYSNDDSDDDDGDADMNDEAERPEDLYCENMDDEDEAWVYKHMRGGREELVRVRQQLRSDYANGSDDEADGGKSDDQRHPKKIKGSTNLAEQTHVNGALSTSQQTKDIGDQSNVENSKSTNSEWDNGQESTGKGEPSISHNPNLKQALLLKPRSSDAILSCPRCFNTVCMDCQQHERYANQFRAMFVMNIGVDWNKRMIYDDAAGGLKLVDSTLIAGTAGGRIQLEENEDNGTTGPDRIPHEDTSNDDESAALYFPVHCSYCQWEVAALDMTDEVYYFYGCIASA
ncbi:hypothetical protein ACHAXA_002835 [Cyclostephanos tholiformis]|uniref:E2F-associated phosphoprotein n=1 Tax=Cyclostephanos tholiformis TaxID=382380 RepID=A0ABD3RZP5_9STRA